MSSLEGAGMCSDCEESPASVESAFSDERGHHLQQEYSPSHAVLDYLRFSIVSHDST